MNVDYNIHLFFVLSYTLVYEFFLKRLCKSACMLTCWPKSCQPAAGMLCCAEHPATATPDNTAAARHALLALNFMIQDTDFESSTLQISYRRSGLMHHMFVVLG